MDFARYYRPALSGVRANARVGLVLQLFAALVVLGYLTSSGVQSTLGRVSVWRADYGVAFSVVSTVFAGGVVPLLVLLATGRVRRENLRSEATFQLVFWCWRAVEVDAFYRLQATLFGAHATPSVVAAKMAFDQFVYNPFWVVPLQTLLFLWKGEGFSVGRVGAALRRKPFLERYVVGLVTSWALWIPAVSAIYAMPTPLQLPLCNLVLCFWCLLLSFVSDDRRADSEAAP